MSQTTEELLAKAYRLEGLITCARLAEDNENYPALRKNGSGLADVLAIMADLAADISGGIDRINDVEAGPGRS